MKSGLQWYRRLIQNFVVLYTFSWSARVDWMFGFVRDV